MLKTVFFGTEKFAAEILKALIKSGQFSFERIICQPDKPTGRKQILQAPAVKITAEEYDLKIDQPETLKNYLWPDDIDLNIVCQYGKIMPKNIVDAPKFGSINIHPSLLPKYRGASPIQSALINGETKTGVTIMLMDEKLDHGAILAQNSLAVEPDDIFTTLNEKLLSLSIKCFLETLPKYLDGEITPQTQDDDQATFCATFTRDDGKINWNVQTSEQIYNLWRGLHPWPGIWTTYDNKRIKLLEVKPSEINLTPGKLVKENNRLFVGAKTGAVEIIQLQPEGSSAMTGINWLNGRRDWQNKTMI